jgi:hypothetical protein
VYVVPFVQTVNNVVTSSSVGATEGVPRALQVTHWVAAGPVHYSQEASHALNAVGVEVES